MTDISLTYYSHAAPEITEHDLVGLLRNAREHNAACGITGMLAFSRGRFIQTLEGSPEHVHEVMEAIAQDPRHYDVNVIEPKEITHRQYAGWSMGFSDSRFQAWRIRRNAR
jgi:hypothetical protein